MNLKLILPSETNSIPTLAPDLRPDAVRAWLEELPLANADFSGKSLLERLGRLNATQLKATVRLQLMKMIQPVADTQIETLRLRYLRALLPLTPRVHEQYRLAQELNAAVALGFKVLLHDLLEEKGGDDPTELLLTSLYLTMHHLSLQLLEAFIVYLPAPARIWAELNQLYEFAEQLAVHNVPVFKEDKESSPRTISLAYRRALLLSLANPHHLMQEEASTVFKLLFRLAPGCQVRKPEPDSAGQCFYVDLRVDAPPRFAADAGKIHAVEPRVVDLSRLLGALQQRIEDMGGNTEADSGQAVSRMALRMQRDMLSRLQTSWGRTTDRGAERQPRLGKLQLAVGLSSCHHHIGGRAAFNPELDAIRIHTGHTPEKRLDLSLVPLEVEHWKADEAQARFTAGIDTPRHSSFDAESEAMDMWRKIYTANAHREAMSDALSPKEAFPIFDWERKNESPDGLCVSYRAASSLPVRVGEVIAYCEPTPGGGSHWAIAAIRWLQVKEERSIEMGVMRLAASARSIATRAIKGVGQGGEYFRSLLVPDADIMEPSATMITPGSIYDVGTELAVNVGERVYYVRLVSLLGASQSYSHFTFELIEPPASELRNIDALKALV